MSEQKQCTILVVEDNESNMKLITSVLVHAGYKELKARDAESGIDLARANKPDLILMDIQLPNMDGLSATRILKDDTATSSIPVVALTALAMDGDKDRILAAGCDGYIAKPVRYKGLIGTLQSFLMQANDEGNIRHTEVDSYCRKIEQAFAQDELVLPTLPEVALKIRDAVESDGGSAQDIAAILTQDTALSARLIKVANSVIYRGREPIDSLQRAISRLGVKVTKDLVVSLSMKQIYQATSDVLDEQFRRSWSRSVEVAAISQMLASSIPSLGTEQALLAGLVHQIGVLPILVFAEDDDKLFDDAVALSAVIHRLQAQIGAFILSSWNFPPHLVAVANECYQFTRHCEGPPDYVDVVQAALVYSGFVKEIEGLEDWSTIPAFQRLGLDPEIDMIDIDENQLMIEEAKKSLME